MHNLTTQEQERLAYAEGYTETAAVLARLDDAHAALGRATAELALFDEVKTARDEFEDETDGLKEELSALFEDYRRMRSERDDARAAARMALDLLEDPDADAFRADAVAAYLRQVLP